MRPDAAELWEAAEEVTRRNLPGPGGHDYGRGPGEPAPNC